MPPTPVHTHIPLRSQVHLNRMGTRNKRLPQIAGLAPKSSVKGQRQKPHTVVNLWHRSPSVSLRERPALPPCPLPTRHQTHLLAATSLNPSSPVMLSTWPGGAALDPGGTPFGGWKNCCGTGASARSLGQHRGKVGETAIRTVWLPENFTPLPGHKHGDKDTVKPGRQPTFVCMNGACTSSTWPLPR